MRAIFTRYIIICLLLGLVFTNCLAQDLGNIAKQKPVTLDGGIQLTGLFYSAHGIPDRSAPFTYVLSGSPILNIYGVVIPFNFILSQENKTVQQPFNQFGISPTYKWITLDLGYRSITFSPYTLAGYTMLGAGVELNPGKFHAAFMYGRLNKGTKLDTSSQSLVPYSFTRTAYAAKLGYGTENNSLTFSFLRGKDDAASGPKKVDSLTDLVLPAANTVGGISAKLTFFKKLFVEGNLGASIYTRDINSPIHPDSTNAIVKFAEKIAIINGTTEYFTAYDADFGFKGKNYLLKFLYVHIDPDFQSFGAYFFDNDLERYAFAPSFGLFKNHFRFNGSIGFQHDDLENQKEETSHKVISNATISADITSKFGVDVIYSNFSNNQQPRIINFADSLKVAQTTQNLSITPHLYLISKTTSNTIVAGTTIMKLNDFNGAYTQGSVSNNINSNQYFINYTYGYLPAKFTAFINLNMLKLVSSGITDKNSGFIIGASQTFLKKANLRASLSGGLSKDIRSDGQSNVFTSNGNLQYTVAKKHTLGLLYYYTNNKPKNELALYPAFTETRVELSYNFTF